MQKTHRNLGKASFSIIFENLTGNGVLILGTKSVATPGELLGYWEAKQLYGNKSISWESLLKPSITMCSNGVEVNWHLAQTLKNKEQIIINDPGLRHVHG